MSEFRNRRFQRLALVQTTLTIVLAGVVSVVIVFLTMGADLTAAARRDVHHRAELTALSVQAYLESLGGLARQIASRTQIRSALAEFVDGARSRESAASFTEPRLLDAVVTEPSVLGVRRLLADGGLFVAVGENPATDLRPDRPIGDPVRVGGRVLVTLRNPIYRDVADATEILGYDLITMDAAPLVRVIANAAGLGPVTAVRLERDGLRILEAGTTGDQAVITERAGPVGPGWTVVASAPEALVLAPVVERLFLVGALILALILVAAALTFRVLRRLSGRVILEAEELSELVRERTAELEGTTRKLQQALSQAELLTGRAEAADRAKTAFLSNAGHELRTPLNAVLGFLELLDGASPADAAQYRRIAYDSGRQMLRMINDLLDLSAATGGRLQFDRAPFSPADTCFDVLAGYLRRLEDKDMEAAFFVSGPDTAVLGDQQRYRQIVQNLVDNACKYSDTGSVTVAVESRQADGRIDFDTTVCDTGRGIPEADLKTIFKPFVRAGESRRYSVPGLGLGLGIVSELVEAMEGRIETHSTEQKGTTITVHLRLPVAESRPPEE